MKREAFFAECLSFAMKVPPKRAQNSPHRLICFLPILYPQYWEDILMWLHGEVTTGSL